MPRLKKEKVVVEEAPKKELISSLPLDTLGSEILNDLRDKINELVEAHNCDCK